MRFIMVSETQYITDNLDTLTFIITVQNLRPACHQIRFMRHRNNAGTKQKHSSEIKEYYETNDYISFSFSSLQVMMIYPIFICALVEG